MEADNAKAMREALTAIRDMAAPRAAFGHSALYRIFVEAERALALPRRNCDVGTAEEQGERCMEQFSQWRRKGDGSKLITAIMAWAQMPYAESEVGK